MEELQEGSFYRLPKSVRNTCRDLGKSHLDVYVALMEAEENIIGYGIAGQWFDCTIHMITQRSAFERVTVLKCIEEMEDTGIIEVKRTKRKKNKKGEVRNEPNRYRLTHVGYRSPNNELPTNGNRISAEGGLNNKKGKKEKREKEIKNPLEGVCVDSRFDTVEMRETMKEYLEYRDENNFSLLKPKQIEGQFAEFREKELTIKEAQGAIRFTMTRGHKGISYPFNSNGYGREKVKEDYDNPLG
jgi:hypothetical protein